VTDGRHSITIAFAEPDREIFRIMRGLLLVNGYRVFGFNNTQPDDIAACRADCIVMTLTNGTISNLHEILDKMSGIPVIAIAESRDTDMLAIVAAGATDFLCKPYQADEFLMRIAKATLNCRSIGPAMRLQTSSFTSLTEREHEVLAELASGASSKEAGRRLGISPRTVDVHRAHIKAKLHVRRSVDLVRLVYDLRRAR
jgi:FixJ family two-component response regulator